MQNYNFILDYIISNQDCVTEYQLIQWIEKNQPEFFQQLGNAPSLYKKHFLLFHSLYWLNENLIKKNLRLIISPLEIRLINNNITSSKHESSVLSTTDTLKAFYLDKKNLQLSESEINQMLKSFWQKYLAIDKKAQAIKTLGLENYDELNIKLLKQRYNCLAMTHHPDKGGDPQKFIQLKEAYASLKSIL